MLSRLVITFLPRSKRLLISWLQSPSAVILELQKIKSATVSMVSPSICHEVVGPDAMIFIFWMLSFKPTFSLSSFTFIKRLFSSSSLSAIRVVSGFPVHHQLWSLLKLMSIESVMPSNHLILCCPLLILPSIFPSIRVFSNESCNSWPKYWFQLQYQSLQWIFSTDFL